MLNEHDQLVVIRGLREGNREAWTALYSEYSVDIWRYVGRLIGNRANEVGDVVQETFLAAARGARQFDAARGSLWSWLAGIAHHQAAAHWRRSGRIERFRKLVAAGEVDLRQWWESAEEPDALFDQQELAELVRGVLSELSADYATLLTAKYLDEDSVDDLACQSGSSVDAIKSKLARARREFRAKFESLTREPTPARVVRDVQA